MAVRTLEEIITSVKNVIGETPTDDELALLEDITDTFTDSADTEDWKRKYEENDEEWRKKYKDRFEGKKVEVEELDDDIEEKLTFESLFSEVK